MKKGLLLFFMMYGGAICMAQSITVDTSTYTVPQLVSQVLINSPCNPSSNVTWRTGTQFGTTNGIGYFENTNPGFPMQSGVILTSGNAANAPGPNTSILNDGNASWIGDTDLEAILAQAGIPMTSTNATVLEFDFTPISPSFSFDFLFASEEYGNYQCQFSDAFAFLLTNTATGQTTNLAVVPGTSLPISVQTIRDYLYNSTCPSANSQFFHRFNGGSNALASATNYNGQTVVMQASAVLIPNTPYHIKLVIADRLDYESDSAIFLSASSFNIGQNVLGPDLTIAAQNAVCAGTSHTLTTGLNPLEYTFVWTKNGVIIANQNGPDLIVSQPGTYGVIYNNINTPCVNPASDTIIVEFYPALITQNPIPLYKCNTGATTYSYNLGLNTPILLAGLNPGMQISYYESAADANSDNNPLPNFYNSTGNQTIYVRITKTNSCFIVKSFQLLLTPPPTATVPHNLVSCAVPGNPANGNFNFSQLNAEILHGQSPSIYTVTYHTTPENANAGNLPLNATSYEAPAGTIYVRVQNGSDPECYTTTQFEISVSPLPPVDILSNVIVCDTYTLEALTNGNYFTGPNGTGTPLFAGNVITSTQLIYIFNAFTTTPFCTSQSSFKVTVVSAQEVTPNNATSCNSYTLPALDYGHFFTAPGGNGTPLTFGATLTTSQTVYVHYVSPDPPFCQINSSFQVTVIPFEALPEFTDVFDCFSYTLPQLNSGNYYTGPAGTGTLLTAGTVITSTQEIYVYKTNNICHDEKSFTVFITITPPATAVDCSNYILPPLPIGNYYTGPAGTGTLLTAGTVITSTQTIYVYVPSNNVPNCTDAMHFDIIISQPFETIPTEVQACATYTLPSLEVGNYYTGPNGTGVQLTPGFVITQSQVVYIYNPFNSGQNCTNQISQNIIINDYPLIDSRADVDTCNAPYILTPLAVGNYFTGPDGTGTQLVAGTAITENQTIYIYATTATNPPCGIGNSFTVTIHNIHADAPADVTRCDLYVLPALTVGNYYTGPGKTGTPMHAGDSITTTQTLYIYAETNERFNCIDEHSFLITIIPTPVVAPVANIKICNAYVLPALAVGNYFTQPNGVGTMLHAGDTLTASEVVYVYAETGTAVNCSDQKVFSVSIFNVEEPEDVFACESYVLPPLTFGKYYRGPNGTGGQVASGSTITNSILLYVYGTAPWTPACTDESSFYITIVKTPQIPAIPATLTTVCDEDGTNDGITLFNLAQLNAAVLGNLNPAEYRVDYFQSAAAAQNDSNPITSTISTVAYVRLSSLLAEDCFSVRPITITVHKLPQPIVKNGAVCIDSKTGNLLNPYTITTGPPSTGYTYIWADANGVLSNAHGNSYTTTVPGTFTLTVTNSSTACVSAPVTIQVIQSEPATVTYTTSNAFDDNPSITVTALGFGGDYEYALDSGPFQDSPVFNNVASGEHTITVNDKNGCEPVLIKALIINYPHYFTPNGDGYHDTWNITDLYFQPSSFIYIYDRYGKLITKIRPRGAGWDGTYNGQPLPSTDYWFTVTYTEFGEEKEFRAHFTLKR
ncbi:choice-of-anchor L domain-containing protein [Flavobacterium kingsejongi]|nr:choice-of-anchor L domain-containing protein [Flavobacterium kingsejongi]